MKYKGIKITKEMLSDPALETFLKKDAEAVRIAQECLASVYECVCPIYTPRGGPNRAPTYIGCGVVVVVDQLFYLLTAAHVVDPYLDQLFIGAKDAVFKVPSWRYFTSAMLAKSLGREPIDDDVAIIPLRGELPPEIQSLALSRDYFDIANPPNDETTHGIIGFLASKSSSKGMTLTDIARPMVTYELSDKIYDELDFDRRKKLVLSFVPYRLRNGSEERSPRPRGMSGGAIFRIIGLPGPLDVPPSAILTPKLAGIFQEQRDENELLPAMSLGTRLSVYLDLVDAYVRKSRREERAEKRTGVSVSLALHLPITPYSGNRQ